MPRRTSTHHAARWRVALVLALGAGLLLAGCGGDAPERPDATGTATATATPTPTPAAIETVTPQADTLATLIEVEDHVERLRGFPLDRDVRRSFVSDAGMRQLIEQELDDEDVLEALREEELLLRELGLIGPRVDLVEEYRGLLGEQVVGLYDPETKSMYVRTGGEPGAAELVTYAHEYQHALQDARFDLLAVDEATRDNRDASLAAAALIEGDATYTQSLYVREALGLGAMLSLLGEAASVPPPTAPPALVDMVLFPYVQGQNFVTAVARRGGVEAIDGAFARLPASTEQVMHPDKYLASEAPRGLADLAIPEGWHVLSEDVIGEYLLQRWLRNVVPAGNVASTAAAGWGGDRYAVIEGPSGAPGLIARVGWDTPADADEFVEALFPAAPRGGVLLRALPDGRSLALARVDDSTVALALTSDPAAAEGLRRALGH